MIEYIFVYSTGVFGPKIEVLDVMVDIHQPALNFAEKCAEIYPDQIYFYVELMI